MRARFVLALGLFFGLASGVFALGVQLVDIYLMRQATSDSALVSSVLELLIIGNGGRRAGAAVRRITAGIGLGAIAGGISEVVHLAGSGLALSVWPPVGTAVAGAGTGGPLAPQAVLAGEVVLLIAFGALFGWLGAWSAIRFGDEADD